MAERPHDVAAPQARSGPHDMSLAARGVVARPTACGVANGVAWPMPWPMAWPSWRSAKVVGWGSRAGRWLAALHGPPVRATRAGALCAYVCV